VGQFLTLYTLNDLTCVASGLSKTSAALMEIRWQKNWSHTTKQWQEV